MNAGILNRRVTIDRNFATQDSSGDPVADWQELATVWAAITPGVGHESDFNNDIRAEMVTVIRVRYSPLTASLTPVDRIRYGARIYNVVNAEDVGMAHDEVLIEARSGLNDG
jgi:SPP1 family predicted phage head-tail adaptor